MHVKIDFMKRQWQLNDRLYRQEPMQRCTLNQCKGACCLYGVWVGLEEEEGIIQNADLIRPHMFLQNQDIENWFQDRHEDDLNFESGKVVHTSVVINKGHYGGSVCIFFGEESKCALQSASEQIGTNRWLLKPFYCVLHPLDLDEEGRITLDETDLLMAEEGSCLRPSEDRVTLLETFSEELIYLMGEENFQKELARNKKVNLRPFFLNKK